MHLMMMSTCDSFAPWHSKVFKCYKQRTSKVAI
jgi:hypothetical protein